MYVFCERMGLNFGLASIGVCHIRSQPTASIKNDLVESYLLSVEMAGLLVVPE